MMKKPIALIILDGYGLAAKGNCNAVCQASTPVMDRLMAECPWQPIRCSGLDVGLPDGQMGNSEVGHTNIGAGRVVYQELTRITKEIQDGTFFENPELVSACQKAKEQGGSVHLMGLLSDGGVHSHITHLYALLELCKRQQVEKVYAHCFLDGRDVPPSSGLSYVKALQEEMEKIGVGQIATISGRYYVMDRDRHWDRVQPAYEAMVLGKGPFFADPVQAVEKSYEQGETDEFMKPVVCCKDAGICHRDSVIFYNFRPDRAREITRTLTDPEFDGFVREGGLVAPYYVCFTQYDAAMPGVQVAFKPQVLENILGQVVSEAGMTQLRIAETEKYAHVTFFFNGGEERVFPGEDRVLIESPKVATFDMKPEMSAYEVTDAVCSRIESGKYDLIVLNFANCDMVGHTGVLPAAIQAVEAVDTCLGRVLASLEKMGGAALVTADHGNAEQMVCPDGTPFTAHTTNEVPLILVGKKAGLKEGGRLCDIAPTLLSMLGLKKPGEMTGESLLTEA